MEKEDIMINVWDGEWVKYTVKECEENFRVTDDDPIDFTKVKKIFIDGGFLTIAYEGYKGNPEDSKFVYKQNTCSGVFVRV